MKHPEKVDFLRTPVEHVDGTSFDARPVLEAMSRMSMTARDLGRAADLYHQMLADPDCTIILTLAGSTSAGGCMRLYSDMVAYGMVDAVVATGASIVDMDFFEALGNRHYQGSPDFDDAMLRSLYIDRIYDTLIDEEALQRCDHTIGEIADSLEPRPYSSREFIREMGRYLTTLPGHRHSLVETAFRYEVPIFCPAFTDSSAGFGLVTHQLRHPERHLTMDSIKDFRELTQLKIHAGTTGLLMIGGGVPKNFVQDTVVCAEIMGVEVPAHKYAVQITVADVRDGACSSSTLKEASSWGKVDHGKEQMVYAEATSVMPLLFSDAWHRGEWRQRARRNLARVLDGAPEECAGTCACAAGGNGKALLATAGA